MRLRRALKRRLSRSIGCSVASSTTEASPLRDWPKRAPAASTPGSRWFRYALSDDSQGEPRQRFFSEALQHEPDANLVKAHAPTSTIKEMGQATSTTSGARTRTARTSPPPGVDKDNHGMDALRYLSTATYSRTHSAPQRHPQIPA